ncbi:MAG: hypothetical protein AB7Q97_01880 [Gammaproteobacteria bacterium]
MNTPEASERLFCPNDELRRCEGCHCGAWRYMESAPRLQSFVCDDPAALIEPEHRPSQVPDSWEWYPAIGDEPASWAKPWDEAAPRALGYCGLAGRP